MGSKNSKKANQASKDPEVICEYEYIICKCPKPRQQPQRPPSPPPSPPPPRHARINNYRNERSSSPGCSDGDESRYYRSSRQPQPQLQPMRQLPLPPPALPPPSGCKKYYVEFCEIQDDDERDHYRHHNNNNRKSITSIESIQSIC